MAGFATTSGSICPKTSQHRIPRHGNNGREDRGTGRKADAILPGELGAETGAAGVRENFGKVWIDGVGYMKDGRRVRDGREKADDKRLYRDRP
jgi:hypothetical protein